MRRTLSPTRITKLQHDPSGPKRQVIWDARVPGFGVRVYASGRKAYVIQYGAAAARRLMTLAPATHGRDVEDMRDHAHDLLRRLRTEGADPLAQKRRSQAGTVAAAVEAYIEARSTGCSDSRRRWSDAEKKRAEGRLRLHLKPIAATPLENLTRRDVRDMHQASSKRAPVEANRALALLRAAINWSLAQGDWKASELAEGENPAARIELNRERSRREWLRPDELPAVIEAIDGEDDPWVRAFFRMLLYTGARKSELLNLQWSDVDLKKRLLTLRDTKNRTDHEIPLTADAVVLLRETPRTLGNEYVFCGRRQGRPLVNPYKPWRRILERAGIDRRVTIHDVRRTVGSLLASAGVSTQQIGKLLNHKSAITAKVYAEIADQSKRDMTETLARLLR